MNHSMIKNYVRKRAKVAEKIETKPCYHGPFTPSMTLLQMLPSLPHFFEIQRSLCAHILQNNCKNNPLIFKANTHSGWLKQVWVSQSWRPHSIVGLSSLWLSAQRAFTHNISRIFAVSLKKSASIQDVQRGPELLGRVCRWKLVSKSAAIYSAHSLITPLFLSQTCSINMAFGCKYIIHSKSSSGFHWVSTIVFQRVLFRCRRWLSPRYTMRCNWRWQSVSHTV